MELISLESPTCAAPHPRETRRWNVEIHLSPGGVVRERTFGRDPQEAVEAALARSYLVPAQVSGIAAYPVASPA